MNYPKIYTLSTVGILKHYTHDYHFHPLRTDFIGPNGVGKSIIADLLQLMFVYDADKIRFGTDGIKKEERVVHKLPYECSTAYCFLNVEVSPFKYISIGIVINRQTGTRIIPFVVTTGPELDSGLDELALGPSQLLFARDFIREGTIPDIKTLALQLKEKGLYLTVFRYKEDTRRYYRFLFDKEMLPVNLSVEENLKAFAKVIQSFSKARSLDLSRSKASKSLKEFLFEDHDNGLLEDYNRQQQALEKLLREYNDLDKFVKILGRKQAGLLSLKKLESAQQESFKEFKKTALQESYQALMLWEEKEEQAKNDKQSLSLRKAELENRISRMPAIKAFVNERRDKAQADLSQLASLDKWQQQANQLGTDITELKILQAGKLPGNWAGELGVTDMATRDAGVIKAAVKLAVPYMQKFASWSDVEMAYKHQLEEITQLQLGARKERQHYERLLEVLEVDSMGSLLQWVLANKEQLSQEDRNLLLYFLTTPLLPPVVATKGDRYIEAAALFGAQTAAAGENGFWLSLGALHEYIAYEKDAAVFESLNSMGESIAAFAAGLRSKIQGLQQKEAAIEQIQKGKAYDRQALDSEIDLFLAVYANVEQLKEAGACVLYLGDKITLLVAEKKEAEKAWLAIKSAMVVQSRYDDPSVIEKELKDMIRLYNRRSGAAERYSGELTKELEQCTAGLSKATAYLFDCIDHVLSGRTAYDALLGDYFRAFSDNEPVFDQIIRAGTLERAEKQYEADQRAYQLKYHETASVFEETANDNSLEVSIEISGHTYGFRALEQALLGSRIKHTDDIANALHEANQSRISMADDIKNEMIKIFENTVRQYKKYKDQVFEVNTFFKGRKISNRFFFGVEFTKNEILKIDFVEDIGLRIRNAARQGELAFDKPVSEFIEEFFRRAARMEERVPIEKLLSPKTYFELGIKLADENGVEIPGSTGETYSAIALLGIARLSVVQAEQRRGLRFIILEEIGSLDNANFNTFPAIAKEFDYQIITMAPHPFRSNLADEWYAYHLIKGRQDPNINFYPSAAYFKTNNASEALEVYLKHLKHELDSDEVPA